VPACRLFILLHTGHTCVVPVKSNNALATAAPHSCAAAAGYNIDEQDRPPLDGDTVIVDITMPSS
jgi:hypothetical protein